eukprot:snap_masked-scaffold_49-processed-gene-1.84-mRNA-1 protein AED:1.00 eAED:1.00 QI:0/0/0/0/1/1/2/0/65
MGIKKSLFGDKVVENRILFLEADIGYLNTKENDANVLTKAVARKVLLKNRKNCFTNLEEEQDKNM